MDQKCTDEVELYSTHVTAVNECTRFGSAPYYRRVTESAAPAYATEAAKDAAFRGLLRRRDERRDRNTNPKLTVYTWFLLIGRQYRLRRLSCSEFIFLTKFAQEL